MPRTHIPALFSFKNEFRRRKERGFVLNPEGIDSSFWEGCEEEERELEDEEGNEEEEKAERDCD